MAAAAHRGSAVSVEVGLTLFLKVGSRGLGEDRKGDKVSQSGTEMVNNESRASLAG